MTYTTRPYQYEGAGFLAERSAILGFRVGLGKTWTALLALDMVAARKVAVICPKTLKYWWEKEIRNYFQDRAEVTVDDLGFNIIRVSVWEDDGLIEIFLTHYEQYIDNSKIRGRLLATTWDVVLCDEVHRLKNPASQRTLNIKKLKTNFKWGLTGTPIADKPMDLWSLLNWVAPFAWSSYWTFVGNYCDQEHNWATGRKEYVGLKEPIDATLAVLYKQTAPYLLVKSLADVGIDLPPVVHTTTWLQMTDKQRKFYEQVQKQTVIELVAELERCGSPLCALDLSRPKDEQLIIKSAGARFVRLQQVASAPTVFKEVDNVKLDWLRDYVEDGLAPAVIMTRFNHTVAKIQALLDELGAEGFIVGTWAKLSEGHNFQHLDTLIAWDLPLYLLEWTQGLGRVDRPGQQAEKVNIIRLVCANTVDEQLIDLIEGKASTAEVIMKWLRGVINEQKEI